VRPCVALLASIVFKVGPSPRGFLLFLVGLKMNCMILVRRYTDLLNHG